MNKPKIHENCMFPLANLQSAESLHIVPKSNPTKFLILLYICSVNLKFVRQFSLYIAKFHNRFEFLYTV